MPTPTLTQEDCQEAIDAVQQAVSEGYKLGGLPSAYERAAKLLGWTPRTVHHRVQRGKELYGLGVGQDPVQVEIEPVADRRAVHDAAFWRRQAKQLKDELAATELALDEVAGIMHRGAAPPAWVLPSPSRDKHKVAGLLHLSDLHVGEVIRSDEIGGLNDYDPAIFVRRIRRVFSAAVETLKRWTTDSNLTGVVVACNGDLVSGDIHDELLRSNALTAHEQVYLAADEICAGIQHLANEFDAVMAVFTPGNHARTTVKTHAKRVSALNYDTMIGEMVRRHFADDPRVQIIIARGPDAVFPVLGWTIFQSHGDALGTGGGKGFAGPTLPIVRGAKNTELQAARVRRHYDIILTAHYHVSANPGGGIFANGSIVGYGEYANRIRAGFEVPQQWCALIHERWCIRDRCELKLEDPVPPPLPRVRVPAVMAAA